MVAVPAATSTDIQWILSMLNNCANTLIVSSCFGLAGQGFNPRALPRRTGRINFVSTLRALRRFFGRFLKPTKHSIRRDTMS